MKNVFIIVLLFFIIFGCTTKPSESEMQKMSLELTKKVLNNINYESNYDILNKALIQEMIYTKLCSLEDFTDDNISRLINTIISTINKLGAVETNYINAIIRSFCLSKLNQEKVLELLKDFKAILSKSGIKLNKDVLVIFLSFMPDISKYKI